MARHDRRRRTTTALSLFTAAAAAVAWTGLGGAAGAAPTSAAAAPPYPASAPGPLATTCATYEGGQEICSGTLPSFDGAPLDFDVTRPTNNSPGPHPLIVMLHGFGNDKHEWESVNDTGDNGDKYHWNSHWFAKHGYYVLTYTARGFGAETSPAAYNPPTPSSPPDPACGGTPPKGGSDCPTRTGTIRVKNKNVEIRDTQWLSANVARAFPGVDTQRVAVTGGSYGGGESWLQAAEPNWTFPNSRDASLPVLKLQVAVPKYPWTDLAASLAPNGRIPGDTKGTGDVYTQSYGPPASTPAAATDGNGTPFGVGKLSYVTALQALGTTTGDFGTVEPTPQNEAPDPEINPAFEPFAAWQARIANVELPYSIAPKTDEKVISDVRRAFSHWHSAYYQPGWKAQDAAGQHTAVYSVSGWTDDLFPTVESFRMFKLLKGLDSRWPVEVEAADIGHSRAGNPSSTWQRINASAFGFLKSQINGAHEANTGVSSQLTTCSDRQNPPAQRVSAKTPEDLGNGTLTMSPNPLHPAVLTPATGAGDPDGVKTDAVVGGVIFKDPTPRGSCTASTAPPSDETFGYRSVSSPLTSHRITVGIGYVDAEYAAVPGTAAQIAARVWDVAPDGTQLLISRGVYRLDPVYGDAPSGRLRVPFYGNHFDLPVGHKLRLDLQQQDDPTYLPPSPTASTVTLKDIHMVLPTRSAGDTPLAGS